MREQDTQGAPSVALPPGLRTASTDLQRRLIGFTARASKRHGNAAHGCETHGPRASFPHSPLARSRGPDTQGAPSVALPPGLRTASTDLQRRLIGFTARASKRHGNAAHGCETHGPRASFPHSPLARSRGPVSGTCSFEKQGVKQSRVSKPGRDTGCRNPGSNQGPLDLQSNALPAELFRHHGLAALTRAKQKAYDELYTRLDTREGQKDLYRLARQRDRDGKDVQQVRVIKDRDGRVLTSEESVQRRWKEYFEELMNEENEREKRVEGVNSVEQKVNKIRKDEVRKALKRMKSGKAVGPDDIPVEVWKYLGEAAVEFLTSLFNRVLESERMPEEWRRSVLVPIFKNKGDVQSCSNYRGIKLMSHTMKLWERVVEARLRKVVEICEQQYGFMPRKSTTDAIFALRILMEKYRDGQRELHCVFVDLEKAYDRVPREELWYCMRKSGVAEKYVRVVQDMYERSRTVVRCAVGQTEEFKVEVGLHQGSALSPFLFAMVMDQLSEEVRQESPVFADDIVICSESREQVEESLERWRFALERRGMKVSRSKTEYMCVNEREGSGTVRLQGEEVKEVQEFKYLGSTVQSNEECGKEVKKRVQAGWNGWRKVSGVLCDRKISARIKEKVYRTVVRPAMLYGLETVSLRKRQESELEVAELKMLRFSLGVTRLDRIRNQYIRGTAHVGCLGDKFREARLRWFGHVQRRESEYIGRRMLDMELPGRRQRGRPKRRYMDEINEDMKLVGASVEDAEDRDRWREMIRCGDP
ncbi:hypothetical protein QTP70_009536 [Hemibagrus guttatus]|uniref:ribonuclease H n=1 Tax=Hemibagrus guttatus TaxID=175788 RepID=A0AAE0RJA0_9TELE|nr:hypothetical protein QTP70_009536 [Hemibagrus guttatus]